MSIFSTDALYEAYRKSKADLFFERSIPNAKKFAEYEDGLEQRIESLLGRLQNARSKRWHNDIDFIGGVSFIPKSLQVPCEADDEPKFFASNASDNWKHIFQSVDDEDGELKAEFRPMADFTVDMHIVCALWVNLIGARLDGCLDASAVGARVRRIGGKREYHKSVWQSFEPYIRSYKKWRDDGFSVVRREVDEGRKVVVLTMDFRRFFHKIDPNFLLNGKFLELVNRRSNGETQFSEDEINFTKHLVKAFETWNKSVPGCNADTPLGVPVGATASRVIANVLLLEFDTIVQQELAPLYYGRYVDDIFLVLRDTGDFHSGRDVLDWFHERMGDVVEQSNDNLLVNLSYAESSELIFQTKKQRVFLIDNADLLDAIKSKVDEVSSEWRLLPDLKAMELSAAAKVLSTSRDGTSESDSLRKADTLLLKRLGFAILLRNVDAIVDALPSKEWTKERHEFYEFSLRHVFAPGKFFELSDYLPRLFGIAVSCSDWKYGHRILDQSLRALRGIEKRAIITLDDQKVSYETASKIWEGHYRHLHSAFADSMLKAMPRDQSPKSLKRCKKLYAQAVDIPLDILELFEDETLVLAQKMFFRDLSRLPYKAHLLGESKRKPEQKSSLPRNLDGDLFSRASDIINLLADCKKSDAHVMPILFPTRPLSAADISVLQPNRGSDVEVLKRSLNVVRGTLYPIDPEPEKPRNRKTLTIGQGKLRDRPRIAVTSLKTEISSWSSAAGAQPDCSAKRFQRLTDLCNAILTTDYKVRPHYVLFPELSIPSKWMRTIAEALLRSGISVIAGEEYTHHGEASRFVDSSARMYLTDNRLGYHTWCALTQLKGKPAHHERDELRSVFGLTLKPSSSALNKKFIVSHFGFRFGILICSELTDMKFRLKFRGKIDSLFVLSWNQDLESFAALVDASALDIHCYVALVNNRAFGDSRVRIPHKSSWRRDAVRVKGGLADYFVVAELDVAALRDFQSHVEPPDYPFKPFPEGFKPSKPRRVIPGTGGRSIDDDT